MIRNYHSQRRDDMRPSSRKQSSGRYGESRPQGPARPRLNRETVDRAWENGAPRNHADYRTRQTNERPANGRRSYDRPNDSLYGRKPSPQGPGRSRPYGDRSTSRGRSFNNDERPFDNRNSGRPYTSRSERSYNNREERPYDNRSNRSYNNRDERPYNSRSNRSYNDRDERPSAGRSSRPSSYPEGEQRSRRRYDDDRAAGRQFPRRNDFDRSAPRYDNRPPRNTRRREGEIDQASSLVGDIGHEEQFEGDYESFDDQEEPLVRRSSPASYREPHLSKTQRDNTAPLHSRVKREPRASTAGKPERKQSAPPAEPKKKAGRSEATRPWQKGYKWPTQ